MGFWSTMGGAAVSGITSGFASGLSSLIKSSHDDKLKLHRPTEGKNDAKGPSTHTSDAQSKNVVNSSVGEKEGLHRSANLTDLASTLGIGNHGVVKNGTLGQMSNPTNLTALSATAELGLRPRSIRWTGELGSELNGRTVIDEQNPVSFSIFGIVAILLVASLALAALRFRRQKHKFEVVAAVDIEQVRDIIGSVV